jgi:hypothetical protein
MKTKTGGKGAPWSEQKKKMERASSGKRKKQAMERRRSKQAGKEGTVKSVTRQRRNEQANAKEEDGKTKHLYEEMSAAQRHESDTGKPVERTGTPA